MSRRERTRDTIGSADAAKVYEEFVATFEGENSGSVNKVWVKAGVYDAGARKEDVSDKGKLYKPTSKLAELAESFASKKAAAESIAASLAKDEKLVFKKKEKEKKKSNLELFKEELKIIQTEREEKHRIKGSFLPEISGRKTRFEPIIPMQTPLYDEIVRGIDNQDPNTTNIYLASISPKVSEQQLMELFGKFGPLASIKIMWPRTEEEKSRGKNCGFVAYMTRKDAERCMKKLCGKDVHGFEMKMSWGKCVPLPARPIYIPPKMLKATLPPPPSGLPFNAQPLSIDKDRIPPPGIPFPNCEEDEPIFEEILQRAIVKVCVPTERSLLMLIHRMVEFVVREGPMFEAMMMNREMDNPLFRFLFDNRSPAHVYYRWKLFSVLQGDSPTRWNLDMFRMFEGGSIWLPPQMNPFVQGMPEDLVSDDEEDRRKTLSKAQRKRLESLLRHLRPERTEIGEAMAFCLEHADAADEIAQCLQESLSGESTALFKKLARLYLLSDILHNTTARLTNASLFRKAFQERITEIFELLHITYDKLEERLVADAFKQRVLHILKAWQDWSVYPQDMLIRIQNVFMGYDGKLIKEEVKEETVEPIKESEDLDGKPLDQEEEEEDIDGAPVSEEDADSDGGMPLDGAALLRHAGMLQSSSKQEVKKESPGPNKQSTIELKKAIVLPGFKPSKWEEVDPTEVESQAFSASKWETVEPSQPSAYEDIDGIPLEEQDETSQTSEKSSTASEDKRMILREIELEVLRYQDDLETGNTPKQKGTTIADQVDAYRHSLIRKSCAKLESSEEDTTPYHRRGKSRSRSRSESPRRNRKQSKRSRRSRSRSRSPAYRRSRYSRSRSRTPPRKSKKSRY